MKKKIKVNPEILEKFYIKKRLRIRNFFSMVWAKIHLIFICPFCPNKTRMIRDIENKGECFWYVNWKKKNYDIPYWMGFSEWRRIRKELKLQKKKKKGRIK